MDGLGQDDLVGQIGSILGQDKLPLVGCVAVSVLNGTFVAERKSLESAVSK